MKKLLFIIVLGLVFSYANAQNSSNTITVSIPQTAIKITELPKAVTSDISKSYPGFVIENAYKITNEAYSTYQVVITKNSNKFNLYYDKSGMIIRKEVPSIPVIQVTPAETDKK